MFRWCSFLLLHTNEMPVINRQATSNQGHPDTYDVKVKGVLPTESECSTDIKYVLVLKVLQLLHSCKMANQVRLLTANKKRW